MALVMVRARSKISMQSEYSTVRVTGLFMRNLFVRWSFSHYLLVLETVCVPSSESISTASNSFLTRYIAMSEDTI